MRKIIYYIKGIISDYLLYLAMQTAPSKESQILIGRFIAQYMKPSPTQEE